MVYLSYRLRELEDAAQRGALFSDLIQAGRGISADDLPAFLDVVAIALDHCDASHAAHAALIADLVAALDRIDTDDPDLLAQLANLSDLLGTAEETI
jgi:hypothetical protein